MFIEEAVAIVEMTDEVVKNVKIVKKKKKLEKVANLAGKKMRK